MLSKLAPLGQTVISIPKETAAVLSVFNSPRERGDDERVETEKRREEKSEREEERRGERRHVYGYRHGRVAELGSLLLFEIPAPNQARIVGVFQLV